VGAQSLVVYLAELIFNDARTQEKKTSKSNSYIRKTKICEFRKINVSIAKIN